MELIAENTEEIHAESRRKNAAKIPSNLRLPSLSDRHKRVTLQGQSHNKFTSLPFDRCHFKVSSMSLANYIIG